ncbi:poly(hydroxyalkanoate) depolymerase family esterase [Pararhizobium capsulatum DSM 1112]|uniref:Poly(Hydroxyalkanoate) depolymerase family esterase n=1 Tax=Pararhizobium capsulatum DSM 1112 TaxID=1121113 RepID=A0ABU0BVP8_9HYPH|nr:PHB depolymerase family esterase [Pararhizobium capsulatum]MDQ0322324.1 poly(hydroxyalkanoate) depolymerase family esterase [Pararhizobium capsulatum DSM 1112]
MRSISDTIARLAKMRSAHSVSNPVEDRLTDLGRFGSNRGELDAKLHMPNGLLPRSALVVVLHGCTQSAAAYDYASGWSRLADDYGFAVLFPQQRRANNANTCFNWFLPGDIGKDQGEAFSIRQMIETTIARYEIDRNRIFITGLSAGGAMTNVMLATNPDMFAGGAIIAGLPYGTASTIPEAFDRMRGQGLPPIDKLQSLLRSASDHKGEWPAISVWQGTSDTTVLPANALAIVDQWRGVHGVAVKADIGEMVDGHIRQTWAASDGREVIEFFSIKNMGHGTPLDTRTGYGRAAPYMLDVGISSTLHIARSWGLIASFEKRVEKNTERPSPDPWAGIPAAPNYGQPTSGIQKTIEDALRAAGLMK